jgi:hypothetical protein
MDSNNGTVNEFASRINKKIKPSRGKLLTDGRMRRNPNRRKSVKVNLRPDQLNALKNLGVNRHDVISRLLDNFIKSAKEVIRESKKGGGQHYKSIVHNM